MSTKVIKAVAFLAHFWTACLEMLRLAKNPISRASLPRDKAPLEAIASKAKTKFRGEILRDFLVPRRFQWYIAEGMLSLPTAKWSMVISFFSGVMASGFAFGCAKDTVEFFNAGIGEVRFPVGEGFLLVIFDYVGPWV